MNAPYRSLSLVLLLCWCLASQAADAQDDAPTLSIAYHQQVDRRLSPPSDEARRYGALALDMLALSGIALTVAQYVAVVDRNPYVQAILIYRLDPVASPLLIGASPVSTGRPGQFDHFETPLGTFAHTTTNPDFRAEGTKNENGIRGYGAKGLRVFDLGW